MLAWPFREAQCRGVLPDLFVVFRRRSLVSVVFGVVRRGRRDDIRSARSMY